MLRNLVQLLLFTFLWITPTQQTEKRSKSGVEMITSRNFRTKLAEYETSGYLLAFTAPWCGHCARLVPIFDSVAQALPSEIGIGKIDATTEPVLTSMFDVKGYPEIFFIKGWEVREYSGPRTRDDLVKYCNGLYKKTDPIPFLYSPFGPFGGFRLAVMSTGNTIVRFYEWFVNGPLGLSQKMAIAMLVLSAMTLGVLFIVWVIVVAEERHLKRD